MVAGYIPSTPSLLSRRAAAAALLFGLAGCPKPGEKFDDFSKRLGNPDLTATPDMAMPSKVFDVTGTFLFAASTVVSPDSYLQMKVASTVTMGMGGTATLDLVFQPLRLSPPPMATREPVGKPIEVKGVMVNAAGGFTIPLMVRALPGEANPISGSEIDADLNLAGTLLSTDRFCGTITGKVLKPIMADLAGSTWSAIRVPDGTMITKDTPKPEVKCPVGGVDGGVTDGSATD